jgi:ComF family protein
MTASESEDRSVTRPSIGRHLGNLARRALDLVIPPACLACREPLSTHDTVCPACWREIRFIRPPLCDRLGLPMPFDPGGTVVSASALADPSDYDRTRAVALFSAVMRDLVHRFKYADTLHARVRFGRWLVVAGADLIAGCDLIMPVPTHTRRLLSRRFNQAAILAREVARLEGKAFAPDLLRRTRATRSQIGLTNAQRRTNVTGAFRLARRAEERITGRRVLLVDDVITTRATINACARTLKRAGATSVDAVALAIRPPGSTMVL